MTNLKSLREHLGLTLKDVSQKCNIDQGLLSKYERKERELSIDNLKKLSSFYNVSPSYLLDMTNNSLPLKIAVYPGSFDPISNGHLDIIERVSKIFDTVYILVSINPKKKYIFSIDERVDMIKRSITNLKNVIVEESDELVLEYAKQKNAKVIIRGLRNFIDYQSEITLFQFNRSIEKNIDTMILFPSRDNLFLSSSSIKELVMFNADISSYVPKGLAPEIKEKILDRLN